MKTTPLKAGDHVYGGADGKTIFVLCAAPVWKPESFGGIWSAQGHRWIASRQKYSGKVNGINEPDLRRAPNPSELF